MDNLREQFARLDMVLDGYYAQMERDLLGLLSYPSVRGEAEPDAPFGRAIDDALQYTLNVAASLGCYTENLDGYCGVADIIGESADQVGILAHLDVVPANAGDWTHDPFSPAIEDGRIYARGAVDDKGPLIAALYAGVALWECGFPLRRSIRYIFGCDEENGFGCMEYFLAHRQQPQLGFTPDAMFPAIIGEKGIAHWRFEDSWEDNSGGIRLLSASAGLANNIVPAKAEALFVDSGDTRAALQQLTAYDSHLTLGERNGGLLLTAEGVAAHASTPEQGENAIVMLLKALSRLELSPAGAHSYIRRLAQLFDDDKYGASLGVAAQDELSALTTVPSMLSISGSGGSLTCDTRFPVSHSSDTYRRKLEDIAARHALRLEGFSGKEPMYVGNESEVADKLLRVYRKMTGDFSAPLVIGGGTYARAFKNFVAFGPEMAGDQPVAHQADEYIEIERLKFITKLYARAIFELAK
ncbi:MAG: Sapep family Mn(2+)-dependent dipeptidase [Bacillota bacterium]|nr:Sapep family Mn(2+)-dependent dipeptidase [Bacillota bacterium]